MTCPCPPPTHRTTCPRVAALRAEEDRIARFASAANNARLSMQAAKRALIAGDETTCAVESERARMELAIAEREVRT